MTFPQQPPFPQQPGYPQQPQQQQWPQQQPGPPMYPQQQQPFPQQQFPQQPFPQQQPQFAPPPGAPQFAPPPQGFAQVNRPDEALVAAAYKKAAEDAVRGGGIKTNFLKILGPQGETKWDRVPVGYENSVIIWLCGGWAPGKMHFVEQESHFFKSAAHPNGFSVSHDRNCAVSGVCKAAELGSSQSNDQSMIQRAKDWGKIKRKYLYNVILLSNPQAHVCQDGVLRSLVLDAGGLLHADIGELIKALNGVANVVDYQVGRPLKLTKKKTGPNAMDIEYKILPANMNGPEPLPPHFAPITHALWDLEKVVIQSTPDQVVKAIQEMGLPVPGGGMAPSFNPSPQPAYPNPYGPPQQQAYPNPYPQQTAPQQPQWQPQPQAAPPQGQWPQQQPPQTAQPQWQPQQPPGAFPQAPGPMMSPPPPYQGQPGMQPPSQPPPLSPPPVAVPPPQALPPWQQQQPPYQPQPSQGPPGGQQLALPLA